MVTSEQSKLSSNMYNLKAQCVRFLATSNGKKVLLYTSCDVRVKSRNQEQIHILGYCWFVLAQNDFFTSRPTTYVNINKYITK